MPPVAVLTLLAVLVLIAARKIGRLQVRIWQAMVGGAFVVLATGQIGPADALRAIDPNVMLFLFGMFVVGQALTLSGYLDQLAYRLLAPVRSSYTLVLWILLVGAVASAFLMNDTVAIMATPLMLRLAREHRLNPRLLLLALAFAVTTGTVVSPIGNPQNLLIASGLRLADPFGVFFRHLFLPTLLNLLISFVFLHWKFRREFRATHVVHGRLEVADVRLAAMARVALVLVVGLVAVRAVVPAGVAGLQLSWIALVGALPLLLFSPRRLELLKGLDWATLAFFAAMFVLMASVWQTGFVQSLLKEFHFNVASVPAVLGMGVVGSQLISNVPLAALFLPLLPHGTGAVAVAMALAAGSTIAGNMLILGAASNVIIVQGAENRGTTLTFMDFACIGVPLTLVQAAVYLVFLAG